MMLISMALMVLLLRPDWLDIALIVGSFLWVTALSVGYLCIDDRRLLALEMRRAESHQEKTSDQV
jgi:hypothetical protein